MDETIPGIGPTTGVIPQTTPTGTPDIGAVLRQAGVTNPAAPNANAIAQILSQLTRKTSIMPGAGQPLPQRQYPQMQDSTTGREFRAVGSNKRSAIGDIFTNVGSMVKTARQNKEAQESRTLSVDLERIMIASQDLPDPSGKTSPTPEQQKNQQIINDVLSDPKKRKQVEKALDISFMGEDKRDKVSKSAMDSALKKVQSMSQGGGTSGGTGAMSEQIPGVGGTPTNVGGVPGQAPQQQRPMPQPQGQVQGQQRPDYSSQLMSKLPSANVMNPELRMLMELVKGGVIPSADVMAKGGFDWDKAVLNSNTRKEITEFIVKNHDKAAMDRLNKTLTSEEARNKLNNEVRKYQADKQLEGINNKISEMKKVLEGKGDPKLQAKYTAEIKVLENRMKDAQKIVAGMDAQFWPLNKEDKAKLQTAKDTINEVRQTYTALQQKLNKEQGIVIQGLNDAGAGGSINTGNGSGEPTSTGAGASNIKEITDAINALANSGNLD